MCFAWSPQGHLSKFATILAQYAIASHPINMALTFTTKDKYHVSFTEDPSLFKGGPGNTVCL